MQQQQQQQEQQQGHGWRVRPVEVAPLPRAGQRRGLARGDILADGGVHTVRARRGQVVKAEPLLSGFEVHHVWGVGCEILRAAVCSFSRWSEAGAVGWSGKG